jgi:diguanylate cyclase (GGDEF)-like protein/PAS domain S-box-containing protein
MPYQYLFYCFSILLLVYAFDHARRPYRQQYLTLIVATIIPLVGSILYILAVPPFENLNPASFLFGIASLVFARAIFSYHILDIIPVARDTVVEHLKDAVLVFDTSLRLIDFNLSAIRLFPTIKNDMIGLPASEVFSRNDSLLTQITSDIEENEIDLDLKDEKSGNQRHYRSSLSSICCRNGQKLGKVLIISDITTQINLLRRMEWLATTDELTELNNRRSLFQQATMEMERARRYGRPISFILMDLDHFKRINDSYGHAAGDEALRETARRIRTSIRDTDIAGRYGGEEFAICLPESPQDTAVKFAERLRSLIADSKFSYGKKQFSLTASFGIIGRDKIDEETLEELFAKADKALYLAKEKGRNLCIPFSY